MIRFCAFVLLTAGALAAQNSSVQATGTATVNVQPDQAQLTIGVVTQAATAQDAAAQNATQTNAMIAAVQKLLAGKGTIETISYSVSPRYSNSVNQPPVIVGYTASNTLQVTTADLNLPGSLIDAANAAGANSISGVTFGLHDPEPIMLQALGQASKRALARAAAIAAGLGKQTGPVISAQEGANYSPITGVAAGVASSTPIVSGTVGVTATVTVTVQLQ